MARDIARLLDWLFWRL